jgi:hypothetical protein
VRCLVGGRGAGGPGDASGGPAQARPDDVGQHTLGGSLVAGLLVGPGIGRHGPVREDPVIFRERLHDVVRQGLERPHDMAGQLGVDPFASLSCRHWLTSTVISVICLPDGVNRRLRRGRRRRGARTSLARGPEPAEAHRACDLAAVLGLDERVAAIANRDRSNRVQTGVLQDGLGVGGLPDPSRIQPGPLDRSGAGGCCWAAVATLGRWRRYQTLSRNAP